MLFKLEGHTDNVYSLTLLSNGWLASGSEDKTIKIWNLAERKKIGTLEGHQDSVASLKTLKYGNLVSYSLDDTIKIWNPYLTKNNLILTITGHRNVSWVLPLGVLANETLVTCSAERVAETSTLRLWNPSDGQLIKSVSVDIKSVYAFLVLLDDQVALGSLDGRIKIIDLKEGIEVASTAGEDDCDSIYSLAQLPNGSLVSFCCKNDEPKINIWSINGGLNHLVQIVTTDHTSTIYSLTISHDETLLVSGSFNGSIKLWPIINRTLV